MLNIMGERLPRSSDDTGLVTELVDMKSKLCGMSDQSILSLKETSQATRDTLLLSLYHDLLFLFTIIDPTRIAHVGLRMTQIIMTRGLSCMSPVALAQFALVLVNTGDASLGYRMSKLSLRLLEREDSKRYMSAVIVVIGATVTWVA